MVKTRYSKPAKDIAGEFDVLVEQEAALLDMVRRLNGQLLTCLSRVECLLCGASLAKANTIHHRGVPFCLCGTCGHIQSRNLPDEAFQSAVGAALGYDAIYTAPDRAAWLSRRDRVYRPKAEWVTDVLKEQGRKPEALSWADIGCGTGGFLQALRDMGCASVRGFDRDRHNIKVAHEMLGKDLVTDHAGSVADAIRDSKADVYSAFFVMEHVDRPLDVAKALAAKPAGTVFAFAVPTFGFATIFESMVEDHYPRNLDAMMHTQLYTKESIDYFLKQAGFAREAEWIFGQDAMDLARFVAVHLKPRYPAALYDKIIDEMAGLVDPLQQAFDRAGFTDSRHILAVKRA